MRPNPRRLFRVFGPGGFAEGGELGVEELGGEGAGEGFDGFALFGVRAASLDWERASSAWRRLRLAAGGR